ncbi:hybrid sensor histidine kinase/response regulator [Bacteroidia bacterium]|nr:hybrid sensor histidine kinase/response regulator [Bacteroidia bacterium]
MSSKRTFSIVKDNTGFIWISTRQGIDRYDGNHIQAYSLTDGAADLTGRINILVKDLSGAVWAFTNQGQIFQYNIHSDSYLLKVDLATMPFLTSPYLTGIFFADNDRMIVYGSFGSYVYSLKKQTFQQIRSVGDADVFAITAINDSTFAIGTEKGLLITGLAFQKEQVVEKQTFPVKVNDRIQCLYYDAFDSSLLIGAFSGKLWLYNVSNHNLQILPYDFKVPVRVVKCYNNTIYIATDGAGLITLNKDTKQPKEVPANIGLNDLNVSSYAFYDVLYDENRLWLATYSDGVYLFDENLPDFNTLSYQQKTNAPFGNSLNTVLEDSNGHLWFGTNDGVYLYQIKNQKWIHLLQSNILSNEARYNALTMCEDDAGQIWVGGSTFGKASRIHSTNLSITDNYYFNNPSGNSANGRIYSILCDSEGNIWLGGLYNPLTKFDPKTKQIKRYDVHAVNTITEQNYTIFVGGSRGLYIHNKSTDSFIETLHKKQTQSPMLSFINAIHEDKQGVLWLGSEGGLIRFNRTSDSLTVYTKADGLSSNSIYGILSDNRNRLWMSTDKGLMCFDPQTGDFLHFGREEGLDDEQFSPRSAFCRKNGELMFGTSRSAVSFVPEKIDRLKINDRLVFTGFRVNYKPVYSSQKHSSLTTHINATREIRLKYNQNTFSFGFTSINFTNPHRTRFEWMLEGYDKDWIRETNINNAYYTNVPPGKYVFRLRSVNTNDDSAIDNRIIDIQIRPPFWATAIAKIIYCLIIGAIVWFFILYWKERMEKQHTSDKIRFFTHTAHELKTPVSLINGPLHELKEKEKLSPGGQTLLELAVRNTERLHNLVTQLIDFQRTEMTTVKLSISEHELTAYINDRLQTFQALVNRKNIRLSAVFHIEALRVWFDEDKMDKIINNLLSNAVKYTPENGEIIISVSSDKNRWTMAVRDTGIGIPKNRQKEIFKPFYRAENAVNSTETGSGIGLSFTKNLVQLHQGDISFESIEGIGSVFTVHFPVRLGKFSAKKHIEPVNAYPAQKENSSTPATQKSSVVLVEDNDELRLFLKQCLGDKYIVNEAINGKQGLQLIRIIFPELVISDVMMPEMDGYELCRQIKENKETSHIPVILLTALSDKSNILKGYELGADNYISKPFDSEILKLTIENTIATRQALRKNLMAPLRNEEIQPDKTLNTNPLDKAFLDEVIALIDRNITDSEFSINDLCREMAMSRTSFYNKMKILTDQSPNEFIRLIRLNRAAKLMKEGRLSVTDIAASTGFGDVKYFSTAFKKHFGVSPSKYEGKL